jgi:4-hydroxy-2-oxoheptanedioate aldolase
VICTSIKAGLGSRSLLVGIGLSLGCLRSVDMVARTQFDFVMVDTQHGHFDKSSATDAIRAIAGGRGPCPLARVSANESGPVNDLLPMVESAAEARRAASAVYYPPMGRRSKGSLAPVIYGQDYAQEANGSVALVVMIETPEGIDRAAEILAVDGVDGCLVGSSDLALALQTTKEGPELECAVDRAVEAARLCGKPVGINVGSADDAERWAARGLSFFLASHDLTLLGGAIASFDSSFARLRSRS